MSAELIVFSTADATPTLADGGPLPAAARWIRFPYYARTHQSTVRGLVEVLKDAAPHCFIGQGILCVSGDAAGYAVEAITNIDPDFFTLLSHALGQADGRKFPSSLIWEVLVDITGRFDVSWANGLNDAFSGFYEYAQAEEHFFLVGDGPPFGLPGSTSYTGITNINALSAGFTKSFKSWWLKRPTNQIARRLAAPLFSYASELEKRKPIPPAKLNDAAFRASLRTLLLHQCAFLFARSSRLSAAGDQMSAFLSSFRCIELIADLILIERTSTTCDFQGNLRFANRFNGLKDKLTIAMSNVGLSGSPQEKALTHFIEVRNTSLMAHGYLGVKPSDVVNASASIENAAVDILGLLLLDSDWLPIRNKIRQSPDIKTIAETMFELWLKPRCQDLAKVN